MANAGTSKPRVVIYGCGQYGGFIARFAVQKGWPIVAAFNRAGAKVGQDLGRVIGLDRDIGVVVQDCDTANYEPLRGKADIGIVAQTNTLSVNLPAYRRLLNAGLNVGCHGSESYLPYRCNEAVAAEIDEMAKKNDVTFCGSAIWDMSRIWSGLLVAGPCTELKSLYHSSITDAHGQANSLAQARQVGINMTLDEYKALGLEKTPLPISYKTIPEQVLIGLGYTLSKTLCSVEPVVLDVPTPTWYIPEGAIPPGKVIGSRVLIEVQTREGVTAKAKIELRILLPDEIEHTYWEVVDGMPHTRVRVERDDSAHATAANLFNRIPDIIAAPPGIQPVYRLGPLKTTAVI
jgi:4-hydroxy-tetrahydrodipicolinate reductase